MKKQANESTNELVKDIFSPDSFFEQATQITKAHAYDILAEENTRLRNRVKFLEELINEYTLKMKANLSGGKVDEFLKEQTNDLPNGLFNQYKK